eukprot:CAMPEP_0177470950 /NCGR_PEP_ID=MMETSP0369-20130122/20492_1 /TAXON_ID=447022 ORGANISM="Scrippsiella hangoei-like, Strain SHHI-4" /NCGR_SAMPLE_ID=MMETSP0369 /ASSEMBLY_ACC=CAM_ASM_000364 /LENGTH=63 /DNA_ID=CAMNT_0018945479 /DNA_START=78 /DNA_END=265 /DNA_ORIENTATION=+
MAGRISVVLYVAGVGVCHSGISTGARPTNLQLNTCSTLIGLVLRQPQEVLSAGTSWNDGHLQG